MWNYLEALFTLSLRGQGSIAYHALEHMKYHVGHNYNLISGSSMFHAAKIQLLASALSKRTHLTVYRQLWHWVNVVFNSYSKARKQEIGPDKACAEWLMRNGAFVKWKGHSDFVEHYNLLPHYPNTPDVFIQEINAINASLMTIGFEYFKGCNHIERIRFEQCKLISDRSMAKLVYLEKSLQSLEIISCFYITDVGVLSLMKLGNLKKLNLENLIAVKNKDNKTIEELRHGLPTCEIHYIGSK